MNYIPLSMLPRGTFAIIERIHSSPDLRHSLMSMGIIEGMRLRILHEGPFGRDPIAIEMDGHTLALRRADAARILVAAEENR